MLDKISNANIYFKIELKNFWLFVYPLDFQNWQCKHILETSLHPELWNIGPFCLERK